ncbi:type I secretion system permease/ATPase [Devosia sp. Root413D1]|uniref:type I secretion system permease/ATPase n=1 Tax=Devosia sp. Root413D1 TaxID=1736531 RepID=UPI0009EB96DA|nr:type I secretion system permease/ATPase [Devosia sp. Root413D1]
MPTLLGLAAKAAGPIAAFTLVSLLSNLIMLVGSIFMLQVYDRVLPSRSLPTLWALALLVVGMYGVYAIVEVVRTRMAARFSALVDATVAPLAFQAGIRAKLLSQTGPQADPVRDVDSVRQFLAGPGPMSLFDLPWLPVYVAAIFLLHPLLGWVTVGGAVVMTLLLVANELLSQRPSKDVAVATARRQTQFDDARSSAESVAAMGLMPAIVARWKGASAELNQAQRRAGDSSGLYSALTKSFRFLLQSAVLAAGAYLVIRNEATGGVMIAASIISSRALAPIEQITGQWRAFVAARQAWRRLASALSATQTRQPEVTLPAPSHSLSVQQLAAGPSRQAVIVQGVTFELQAGEAVGILGPSGSGKSTVARALVGAWPVLQGEIRLDGSELSHFDADRLGRHVGYLSQHVELFAGTVAENISRFQPDADEQALFAAATAAQVHELIASLPKGYETLIGERGTALSSGQRQRIGLARALYGNPFLIVLDEPNSNLDPEGDQALTEAIKAAKARGAIVAIVAHRPSAILAADKVLFMRGGRQQAFGPKDEILARIAQPPAATKPAAVTQPAPATKQRSIAVVPNVQ